MIVESFMLFLSLVFSLLYLEIWLTNILNKRNVVSTDIHSILLFIACINWAIFYYLTNN